MKIAFRLECPHCHWGQEWRDLYVNQGWIELTCNHCDLKYFAKISIPTVDVQTNKEHPGEPSSAKSKGFGRNMENRPTYEGL